MPDDNRPDHVGSQPNNTGDETMIYSSAIRSLCRAHGLTWAECVERFGHRLDYVQCNVVTAESVAALT